MASFVAHPSGLAIALSGPGMQAAMVTEANKAKRYAETISPVRTGRYRYGRIVVSRKVDSTGRIVHVHTRPLPAGLTGGFRVVSGVHNGKAWARLENRTPYAIYLEFGTRYMKAQRILQRAASAIGK